MDSRKFAVLTVQIMERLSVFTFTEEFPCSPIAPHFNPAAVNARCRSALKTSDRTASRMAAMRHWAHAHRLYVERLF